MKCDEFQNVIELGDLPALMALSREITDAQRDELRDVAAGMMHRQRRQAHFGWDQNLLEDSPGERDGHWKWIQELIKRHPEPWRTLAGIDEAVAAMREGRLAEVAPFRLIHVPALTACEPIVPIASVDELLDAVGHTIERVDSADDIERIIDGIARLADQRPDDLTKRAAPLLKRLPKSRDDFNWSGSSSNHGLSGQTAPTAVQNFVLTWLHGKEVRLTDYAAGRQINYWMTQRLKEVRSRVADQKSTRLLSTPTHRGGWLAPRVFVERLLGWQERQEAVLPRDLLQALLRLAPDERAAAREAAAPVATTIGRMVRWALGGDEGPTSVDESDLALWLAAGRCRSPQGDIPELKPFALIEHLPFGSSDTQLVWKEAITSSLGSPQASTFAVSALLEELKTTLSHDDEGEVIEDAAAFEETLAKHLKAATEAVMTAVRANTAQPDVTASSTEAVLPEERLLYKVDAPLVAYWTPRQEDGSDDNFVTCGLARLSFVGSAISQHWDRQWLATCWPLNADPFFSTALTGIRSRLNSSKASVFEPNHVLLDPLFHPDRPWTEMSCVLLALSLLNREADTRGAAVDALIASISDGRADAKLLAATWFKMSSSEFLKLNRIAEALNAAAVVSPLHRWFAADVTQRLLAQFTTWPTDGHHLLSPLVEWLTELDMPLTEAARSKLTSLKPTGKATKLSQALLKRTTPATPSANHQTATQLVLEQRLDRAERWVGAT